MSCEQVSAGKKALKHNGLIAEIQGMRANSTSDIYRTRDTIDALAVVSLASIAGVATAMKSVTGRLTGGQYGR